MSVERSRPHPIRMGEAETLIRHPGWTLALTVALITVRWVWVAGIGDYGWTYEAAHRIAHGEVQYRDFISSLPPLANYTLGGLLFFFGDSLWLFSIHLYLWWYAALVAGWVLSRRLAVSLEIQATALVLAA